ncbi:hypothetical protein DFP97_109238 [Paenibacillus prosopidis]|uniref:Uncharacterized protein n=1 Tax=Paenibacillus prosopidis TaxID=630520 RepID=A0A368VZ23_9BACL|nr:hypothetical protein DFP97_109238 [Paenibacillus prosopidis]
MKKAVAFIIIAVAFLVGTTFATINAEHIYAITSCH